ncbi:MAG: hypothetical protein RG740_02070, partial [Acholeplasmataceae bacterium]|nr:hypothetical protein [Acholeplasmataceae bacterium]
LAVGFKGYGNEYYKIYKKKNGILNFKNSNHYISLEVNFERNTILYIFKKTSSNFVEVLFNFRKESAKVKFSVSLDASLNSLFTNDYLIKQFEIANSEHYGVAVSSHEYDIETLEFIRSHSTGNHNGFEKYLSEAKDFIQKNLSSKLGIKEVNIFQ